MVAGRVVVVVRRSLPALLACVVLAGSAPAHAIANLYSSDTGLGGIYEGASYSYRTRISAHTWSADSVVIDLPPAVVLRGIDGIDRTSTWRDQIVSAGTLATCGVSPFTCGPATYLPAALPGGEFRVSTRVAAGTGHQQILIENYLGGNLVASGDWGLDFLILVRHDPAAVCDTDPHADYQELGSSIFGQSGDPALCSIAPPPIETFNSAVGTSFVLFRGTGLPFETTITWDGGIGGQPVTINDDVQVTVSRVLDCDPPAVCDPGGTTVIEVVDAGTFPARTTIRAINTPDIPASSSATSKDLTALLTVSHAGFVATELITVRLREEDPAIFEIAGPPSPGAADSPHLFTVTTAVDADGGNQPRVATWSLTSSAVTVDQAWLQPTTPERFYEQQLIVPESALDAAGSDSIVVTIHAVARGPSGPGLERTIDMTISRPPAPLPSCVIEHGTPGAGLSTDLLLRIDDPADRQTVNDPVLWRLPGGEGQLTAADTNPTELIAPLQPGSVVVEAESVACAPQITRATVEVLSELDVELSIDRKEVSPGGWLQLTGKITNHGLERRDGVRLRVRADPALQPLRTMPVPVSGFIPVPPSAPIGGAATILPVTKQRLVDFELGLDPGQTHTFRLPMLARAAMQGTTASIVLEAYYPGGARVDAETAVDVARGRVRILSDPELSEATLFGKVFDDRNGDGVQGEGEKGIAKAMVALSSSVYALTDKHGKYHVARLRPGRHAVKINLASLPLGAVATTDVRREVTLTPGIFTRINFGVRLPDLNSSRPLVLATRGSGIRLEKGAPVYRVRLDVETGHSVKAYRGKHRVDAQPAEDGTSTLDLPLDPAKPHWLLVERAGDGRTWLWSFAVHTYERNVGGTLVIPWGPRPIARLLLPPEGKSRVTKVVVRGEASRALVLELGPTGKPTCKLEVEIKDGPAALRCDIDVGEGLDELELIIDAGPDEAGDDPPKQAFRIKTEIDPTVHFFVGLLGVEAGYVVKRQTFDNPATGEPQREEQISWDVGGAFFYRGVIKGKYLITAGADASVREVFMNDTGAFRPARRIVSQLFTHDTRRIFRDLDPEKYYPVYGDASVTVDERESGGRFFVRLEVDESYVKWGGINTAIDDAEYGRYVRSLYGFGGRLALGGAEESVRVRAVGFAAQPQTSAARDELLVTGGSLYFMSHRNLVEGSLRVTLEVLDEISGLPTRATPLTEGSDYEADYVGGRIVLDSALPYRSFGTSITGDASGGHTSRLLVEYEYRPGGDPTRDWSMGARVNGTYGPLTIGATGVTELKGTGRKAAKLSPKYTLFGGTALLDMGEPLRLRVAVAHSRDGSHAMASSSDGGHTFEAAADAADRSGTAASVEMTTGFGGAVAGVYGRLAESGFTDSRTAAGRRLAQGGLRLQAELPSRTTLTGNYDYRELQPDGQATLVRQLGLLGASQRLGALKLEIEGRHEAMTSQNRNRTLAGALVGYQLSPDWTVSVRRRQLVAADSTTRDGSPSGETAAGLLMTRGKQWLLGAELGVTDDIDAFGRVQGSMPIGEETTLYAGYVQSSRLSVGTSSGAEKTKPDGVVVGGRRSLDDGTLLYSEQHLRVDGRERVLTRTVGGRLPFGDRLHLSVTYERGGVASDDLNLAVKQRDAGSIGGAYAGERFSARLVVDGRFDKRESGRTGAFGVHGRVDLRATDALTLALSGRGGNGYSRVAQASEWRNGLAAWEGALGFALRPIGHDWINAFGRYVLMFERDRIATGSDEPGDRMRALSHIAALAAVVEVWGPFAISPKVAYRNSTIHVAGEQTKDQALVTALRADYHLTASWDVALEGRACNAPGDALLDTGFGALAELSMLVLEWLRVGAGYNFSSISTDTVRCEEPGARGIYVRAEVVY